MRWGPGYLRREPLQIFEDLNKCRQEEQRRRHGGSNAERGKEANRAQAWMKRQEKPGEADQGSQRPHPYMLACGAEDVAHGARAFLTVAVHKVNPRIVANAEDGR